jgi:N-acetylglucosamine kinase-like BadF-type ATPase
MCGCARYLVAWQQLWRINKVKPDTSLVMGIDGGGSRTTAWLANPDREILGRGESGTSNYQSVGETTATGSILQAIQSAFAQAGLTTRKLDSLCLGLAGFGRDDDRRLIYNWVVAVGVAEKVTVVNDADLLLWAATPEGWGLGLVCGTGSIAIGRTMNGETARAGGWGYLIGDEGSGYALGLAALRAAVQAADRRIPATSLQAGILEALGLEQVAQLVATLYQNNPGREGIAQLSEVVFSSARQGDRQAALILRQAAADLAKAGLAVCQQLDWSSPIPCALGGGVFVHHPELGRSVTRRIGRGGFRLKPVQITSEPVCGAVRLALRMLGPNPP